MPRIAMIGAGSVVFVKNLLTDILSLPELRRCTIALHDIDAERLETAEGIARRAAEQLAGEHHAAGPEERDHGHGRIVDIR